MGHEGMTVHKGDIVAYYKDKDKPLKVLSEPYQYCGKEVVTARAIKKNRHKVCTL